MTNPDREELVKLADLFFQAIVDGYKGKIEYGFLIVENPDASPERIALGGVDPNLVLDAKALLIALRRLASSDGVVKGEPEPVAWPANLNPRTLDLVQRFALALAKKLRLAEEKYGHTDGWLRDDWEAECRDHLYQHLEKGDPRDVAAYCAFMWHHGWITYRPAITAPPADAGMREALEFYANEWLGSEGEGGKIEYEPTDRLIADHGGRADAALTAPGATTKSDGGEATYRIGRWLSAALDDPNVCSQMKADILAWMEAGKPNTRPSDPSLTRSEVTVLTKRLDQVLKVMRGARNRSEPMAVWADDIKAVEDARALLDQFEIRRK